MKFAIGKASMATLCLAVAILTQPAYSVTNELVASSESHSIEKFDSSGNWQAASIQPVGLTFGPNNNLTVNSVFNGQV